MPITACSIAAQAASRAAVPPPGVELHAQPDQVLRASTLMSPVTIGAMAASHAMASATSPSSHAPSFAPDSDAGGAAGGPPFPDLRGPLVLQGRAGVEQDQVGQRDMRPGFDRLPGPLGQQPTSGQPPHRLLERVVVPLILGPRVLGPGRGGQRVQHPAHHLRALRREVPVHDSRPAERGGQFQATVIEVPVRVLVGQVPSSPLVHLPEQRGQLLQPQLRSSGRQENLVGVVPVLLRELAGPQADQPAYRLGDLPGRQGRDVPGGGWRSVWPRRCARRRRPW